MESERSSNLTQIDSTEAPRTGIVIQEGRTSTSTTTTTAAATTVAANNPTDGDNMISNLPPPFKRDADLILPITNVVRIMRTALPAHAKITDDAKEMMQECVSDFINFITSEASERCHRESRKMISPDDLLSAMGSLGFDDYIDPLTMFLEKYRAHKPKQGVHRPAAQMDQPPVPPPPPRMLSQGNVPTLPTTTSTYAPDGDNDYVGLPKMDGDGHVMGSQSGGEGSSGGAEFKSF